MFKFYEQAIIDNPIEYLIKIDDPKYKSDHYKIHYDSILKYSQAIANGQINADAFNDENTLKAISNRKNQLQEICDVFMTPMLKIRSHVKSGLQSGNLRKDEYWNMDHSDFAKDVIKDLVESISPTNHILSDSFNWEYVELFVCVFERLLKEIVIAKKVIKPNDWYDLFNLVYVSPERKYWTNEKYWLRLIRESKLDKYLVTQ